MWVMVVRSTSVGRHVEARRAGRHHVACTYDSQVGCCVAAWVVSGQGACLDLPARLCRSACPRGCPPPGHRQRAAPGLHDTTALCQLAETSCGWGAGGLPSAELLSPCGGAWTPERRTRRRHRGQERECCQVGEDPFGAHDCKMARSCARGRLLPRAGAAGASAQGAGRQIRSASVGQGSCCRSRQVQQSCLSWAATRTEGAAAGQGSSARDQPGSDLQRP